GVLVRGLGDAKRGWALAADIRRGGGGSVLGFRRTWGTGSAVRDDRTAEAVRHTWTASPDAAACGRPGTLNAAARLLSPWCRRDRADRTPHPTSSATCNVCGFRIVPRARRGSTPRSSDRPCDSA